MTYLKPPFHLEHIGSFLRPDRLLDAARKQQTVVLGQVSTKTPELESKDELKRRIEEASRYVPLERLALSPQCGFSSGGGGGQVVTQDDTRRKIALMVEVVDEVWGGA